MGRLLLAGAGHAHMAVMAAIPDLVAQGHEVIAVGPGERHYYSGMGPGMLGGTYGPEEISFPVRSMVEDRGGTFIQGKVGVIDAPGHVVALETGQEVPYDVLSCNLGSFVPDPRLAMEGASPAPGPSDLAEEGASRNEQPSPDVFPVKPIERLWEARQRILELGRDGPVRIGVCGGGPAALEIAGNAWAAGKEQQGRGAVVQIFTGGKLLRNMPERIRRKAERALSKRRIEIVSGSYVQAVRSGEIRLENGRHYPQEIIFLALGVRPSPVFRRSGLELGEDGGLLVNQFLQSTSHPDIFGGGDCIAFQPRPLDKVGVYAVRQNPVLLHNLRAHLEGRSLRSFDPGGDYLLIFNIGGGKGILHKNGLVLGGRPAFWLKDSIDRRFIRAFSPSSP